MLAVAGDAQSIADLETDIENKQARIRADIAAATGKNYVPPASRAPIEEVIEVGIAMRGWNPSKSAKDFFELCKYLHGCEVTRYIDRPSSERKGASRILNQQIDYYHLSYLPFVQAFVTNDAVLRETAQKLAKMFYPEVEIHDVASYHSKWMRDRLTSTD